MTNKLIWLLIGIVVGILLTTYSVCNGPSDAKFQQTIDSLNKVIDSEKIIVDEQNLIIAGLAKKDSALAKQVVYLAQERNKARAEANKKANNPNLSNSDTLHKFFVDRYPTEDKTAFSLPKESAVGAARDLLYCDGDRQDLSYADSINTVLGQQIVIKDSTIHSFQIKDTAQQNIISLQDVKYNTLNKEYTKVNTQNKLLKLSTKAVTAVAAILTVILVVK
jgi:hypothetical protein